ncbi:MAG: hypothetical protein KatS3mg002_0276 [Candidatus Woesearchaeota archaeon]|nr:MAG: hypothetical protein KatS3mg002_0276 [Candidatus Woesearchaeota archaeon]
MVTRFADILVLIWDEKNFIDEIINFVGETTTETEEEKIEKRLMLQVASALKNEEQEKKLFDGFTKYLEKGSLCIIANKDVNSKRPFSNIYKFENGVISISAI